MAGHWSENPQQLNDFLDVLTEANVIEEDDIRDVIRQPYKYDEIYDNWATVGYPLPDSGESWDEFVSSLETDEESDEE